MEARNVGINGGNRYDQYNISEVGLSVGFFAHKLLSKVMHEQRHTTKHDIYQRQWKVLGAEICIVLPLCIGKV